MKLITASELRTARRCAREHRFRYVDLVRPVENAGAMRFGSLLHLALEAWWTCVQEGMSPEGRVSAAVAAIGHHEAAPFDRVQAEELMLGYTVRWHEQALDVLAVEAEFRCELRNPATGAASRTFALGGKIDAIARERETGRVVIVEHKTTSEDVTAGSPYWARLQLDAQVSTYFVGARSLGYEVEACLYDVIHKPRIRPLLATPVEARRYTKGGLLYANQREQDETPEEYRARLRADIEQDPARYFARGEVVRLEDEERDAAFDAWHLSRQVRENEIAGRYPRNPDACVQYGRACDYWPVCSRETTADDPSRYRKAERAHEELAPEAPKEEEAAE